MAGRALASQQEIGEQTAGYDESPQSEPLSVRCHYVRPFNDMDPCTRYTGPCGAGFQRDLNERRGIVLPAVTVEIDR